MPERIWQGRKIQVLVNLNRNLILLTYGRWHKKIPPITVAGFFGFQSSNRIRFDDGWKLPAFRP
jgi:hypothetical protein